MGCNASYGLPSVKPKVSPSPPPPAARVPVKQTKQPEPDKTQDTGLMDLVCLDLLLGGN